MDSTFNQQLSSHGDKLQSFAFRFTNNLDDANDLVQDTMLKAMRYSQNFESGTNLQAWLFTIMKNTFINNYRRLTMQRQLINTSEDLNYSQLYKSATENVAQNAFVANDIYLALGKLEPQYSVPFMRFFEGYKYQEIADEMQIPIGTVKTRIHVARILLKKTLKMYSDGMEQSVR